MSRYAGAEKHDSLQLLGYEETLNALHVLIGRHVLVLFSGTEGTPFISGIISAASSVASSTNGCRPSYSATTLPRSKRSSSTSVEATRVRDPP